MITANYGLLIGRIIASVVVAVACTEYRADAKPIASRNASRPIQLVQLDANDDRMRNDLAASIARNNRQPANQANMWRPLAEQGDAGAQFMLGIMYAKGLLAPRDDDQAVIWFRKAADQGFADAQYSLGDMYAQGRGTPRDDGQAVFWYRKAAEKGNAQAQLRLSNMYASGRGVPQDAELAKMWSDKAKSPVGHTDLPWRAKAEQGDATSQVIMGLHYHSGEGVPRDEAQALLWYGKAAEQANDLAQFSLGQMYQNGWGVVTDIQMAVNWYRLAAEQGNMQARSELRKLYVEGHLVPVVDDRAGDWWRKLAAQAAAESAAFSAALGSAERGDTDAEVKVGLLYLTGVGTPKDRTKAAAWFGKAAGLGRHDAECLRSALSTADAGWSVPGDNSHSVDLCLYAAYQGYTDAEVILADDYATGRGVPQDKTQSEIWWRKAAEQGRPDAEAHLAAMYLTGDTVPQDNAQSVAWNVRAAEQGDSNALLALNLAVTFAKLNKVTINLPDDLATVNLPGLAMEHAYDSQRDLLKNLWASPVNEAKSRAELQAAGSLYRQLMDRARINSDHPPGSGDTTTPINLGR